MDEGRARVGREVGRRLAGLPGVQRPDYEGLELFLLRDFIRGATCRELIALIDARSAPSELFADNPDPAFRTSQTCNLDPAQPVVASVDEALSALTGLDPAFGERLQGQRYEPGQQFKPHHDYLRATEPYWHRQSQLGGQRTWTAMIYLDRPEAGGETVFPRADLTIVPRPGMLVIWNNMDADGEPNPLTLHQGCAVQAGTKHIVTRWYRERPWGPVAV